MDLHLEDLKKKSKSICTVNDISILSTIIRSGVQCKYHRITHVILSKHIHLFEILQEKQESNIYGLLDEFPECSLSDKI